MSNWRGLQNYIGGNGSWAVILLADADPAERIMRFDAGTKRFTDPTTNASYAVYDKRLLAWRRSNYAFDDIELSLSSERFGLNHRAAGLFLMAFALGGVVGLAISSRTGDIGDAGLMAAIFGLAAMLFVHAARRSVSRKRLR